MQPCLTRMEFVGSNVTRKVKAALRIEAKKRGLSVSMYLYELCLKELKAHGHDVKGEDR
jgi:hypothetical protein